MKRFAAGDYDAKVPVRTRDEIGELCSAFNGMVEDLREKNVVIENKNRENEELLLNVLPAPIANRLRGGEAGIADGFAEVTVAFADLVGFTALTSEMPPQEVVTFLNGLFTRFDVAAQDLGIEKIKTVGDAYMAVCGLPVPVANHAERMVRMAIRMVHITREHAMEHNVTMKLRVGVNSGPVVAGVIGKSKYIYDLWGDTVNLASRMESGGIPDAVQVTRPVYEELKDQFVFEARGTIEVKGKGQHRGLALKAVRAISDQSHLGGSLRTAAAIARQISTSKPLQPLSALRSEKPNRPWLTPQISAPRWRDASSVAAAAAGVNGSAPTTHANAAGSPRSIIRRIDAKPTAASLSRLKSRRSLRHAYSFPRIALLPADVAAWGSCFSSRSTRGRLMMG